MSSCNMVGWLWIVMTIAVNNAHILSGDPRRYPRRLSRSCEVRNVNNPCLNGGRCHVTLSGGEAAEPALVTCRCPPAWTGATCELERDPCTDGSAVCGPGWSCVRNSSNTAAGYDCGCGGRSGWRRLRDGLPRCVDVDECALLAPACFNGGRCHNRAGTYQCVCRPGFVGRRCGQSDGSDGWTNWGLWSACSSRCGPGSRSRRRSRLCADCRPRQQRQRLPCRGPCWAGRRRPYTEPPPTARPRRRPARVKRDVLEGRRGTEMVDSDEAQPPDEDDEQETKLDEEDTRETKRGLDQRGPASEQGKPASPDGGSKRPAPLAPDQSESTTEDEEEAAVQALEADGRRVDGELSAFEHLADKMATFARDLVSRAAATAGRLSHQHEVLLHSINNSSSAARRRTEAARVATATARRAAANETARLQELKRQSGRVHRALRAAAVAAGRWRRLEAEQRRAAESAEHQLPREEAGSRQVALPSQAAGRERDDERLRLQTSVHRLETLLKRQRQATGRLRQRAAAAARRARRAGRQAAQLAERRRRLPLEQAASRRSYTELNERRVAAARRRAHQALLRADASVGRQQELLGRAAAATTGRSLWRPPTPPPPPPPILRLKLLVPEQQPAMKQEISL